MEKTNHFEGDELIVDSIKGDIVYAFDVNNTDDKWAFDENTDIV